MAVHAPVSVLMATCNRARHVGRAIAAILEQSLPPRQVIVVDDGSTDDTESVLAGFGDRIVRLRQPNAGKSAALNRALALATEDHVWVFDDDDLALPDAVSRHMAALAREPGAGFTYSPFVKAESAPDGRLVPLAPAAMPALGPDEVFPRLLLSSFMPQQGSICRTRCFRAIGGFRQDLTRSLDYEFMLRLARRYRAVRVAEPTFWLRVHSGARDRKAGAGETVLGWYRSDRIIFAGIHRDLALWEYLPHMPGAPPPARFDRAAALRARIAAMGRNGLWDEALADLRELLGGGPQAGASPDAMARCLETALGTPLGVRDLIRNPPALRELTVLVRRIGSPRLDAACARRIYHATVFERRMGEYGHAWLMVRAAAGLVGLRGACRALAGKLANRRAAAPERGEAAGETD